MSLYKREGDGGTDFLHHGMSKLYLQIHNVILSTPLASFSQAEYKNNITFISIKQERQC